MAAQIALRLSDLAPPTPEPPKTIYRDIENLPDPVLLGITMRYFNFDTVNLWFRITGSGTGYTFDTVDLGLLGPGTNDYHNLDEFASKARPAAAFTEYITLTLRAYTDAGYTNLKWTYQRNVLVVWIDSTDGSWIIDDIDNFDDGTVMGWAAVNEANNAGGFPTLAAAIDFVLSPPNSCKMTQRSLIGGQTRARMHKTFNTPNRDTIYAILNVRNGGTFNECMGKNMRIQHDAVVRVYLGKPFVGDFVVEIPEDKWTRIVVPLPKNVAINMRIVAEYHRFGPEDDYWTWQDDFKIISK